MVRSVWCVVKSCQFRLNAHLAYNEFWKLCSKFLYSSQLIACHCWVCSTSWLVLCSLRWSGPVFACIFCYQETLPYVQDGCSRVCVRAMFLLLSFLTGFLQYGQHGQLCQAYRLQLEWEFFFETFVGFLENLKPLLVPKSVEHHSQSLRFAGAFGLDRISVRCSVQGVQKVFRVVWKSL